MATDLQDRIRAFGRQRQMLGEHRADDLPSALRGVVGVYSAQPMGALSLAARVPVFDPAAFVALERDRQMVRVQAMHGSMHLVPTATVGRVVAATARPLGRRAWSLRDADMSWEDYEVRRDEVAALTGDRPMSSAKVREQLGWTSAEARAVLTTASVEGVLLKVGPAMVGPAAGPDDAGSNQVTLRSNALGYCSTVAWLGAPFEQPDPDAALAWLAGEYLRAFGPVRVEDLAWWGYCGKRRAAAALAGLDTVEVAPGLLLRAEDEAELAAAEPLPDDAVDVLPVWDAYTMGYQAEGRSRFGLPAVLDRLYDGAGNGLGTILAGGRAVGSWTSRFAGRTMQVEIEELGAPWSAGLLGHVKDRFAQMAPRLGGDDVAITAVEPGAVRNPVGGKGNRRSYDPA